MVTINQSDLGIVDLTIASTVIAEDGFLSLCLTPLYWGCDWEVAKLIEENVRKPIADIPLFLGETVIYQLTIHGDGCNLTVQTVNEQREIFNQSILEKISLAERLLQARDDYNRRFGIGGGGAFLPSPKVFQLENVPLDKESIPAISFPTTSYLIVENGQLFFEIKYVPILWDVPYLFAKITDCLSILPEHHIYRSKVNKYRFKLDNPNASVDHLFEQVKLDIRQDTEQFKDQWREFLKFSGLKIMSSNLF